MTPGELAQLKQIASKLPAVPLEPTAKNNALVRQLESERLRAKLLFLAEDLRKQKKFDEANATLQTFISKNPDHELTPTAQVAIAANLESMGKTDEALATYQQKGLGIGG